MSLQLLAKQMEAKGRKGDSMLVHMTAKEVAALQKMAESAGGSLSVNPETGLVEANFLKRMLPTLVGVGVGMFAGPMAGAAAGAAVGGYQAKRNDQDVAMGALMGGLGGYGGASLGAGLGAAGSQAAQAGAMQTAATQQAAQQATQQAAREALMAEGAKLTGAEAAQTTAQQLAAEKLAQEAAADMARREAGAAVINQAGETAAKDFAAQGLGDRASQGISALMDQGSNVGRDAFMSKFGMKQLGMAAAPMMAAGKRPGDPEVDDELYSYTYDVGRTGAENTPSGSSAERLYFDGRFSPVRKIRARDYAAKGGLMSLAEGGETATAAEVAAPTASEAALAYLMGERSSSAPARSPFIDAQLMQGRPAPMAQAPVVGSDNMYAFDPATGTFLRNPGVPGAESSGSPVGTSFAGSGGDNNVPMSQQTIDFLDRETPPQREARMREVSNLFSLGPMGALANAVTGSGLPGRAPDFGTLFGTSDAYKNMGYDYNQAGGYNPSSGQSYAESVGMGSNMAQDDRDRGGESEGLAGVYDKKEGGLIGLAKGGMASGGFVVPADVVSALGNGSTDAGLRKLSAMMGDVKPIKGKGDGLSDSIPTNIDGKQAARVADGEAYIDPKTVKRLGGAKKLYAMMDKIRAQAHGKTTQQRKVNPARVMA